MNLRWRICPCVLIAITAPWIVMTIKLPTAAHRAMMALGIQYHPHLLQGLLPIATTLLLARLSRPRRGITLPQI